MKYVLSILSILAVALIFVFVGVKPKDNQVNADYLRVHIRANSNQEEDQSVKYIVRDAVVEALIPVLSEVTTKAQAKIMIEENLEYIQDIADRVLKANGKNYTAKARVSNEYFPTKTYDDLTLQNGFYDALILDLGSGQGNNWWCVVYPAFCFLKTKNSGNQVYISKIWEIINSVTKK